ncbi:thiol reductant ABC exporter subunit CydD [Actinocorallia aurantiaca]|uniref:ATP-binding cassette subfamily C protein CydD n=1 Tax=Actinocorallia aurantiaca TaxID=46204 RepID=A0ABN3U147_9ACTN
MKPFDPRLAAYARSTVPYLATCVLLGALGAACVIAQSWLLAHAIATLTVPLALLGVFALRALLSWAQEIAAHRSSAGVKAELREAVLKSAIDAETPARSGSLAALVTRGVDALDPYFSRYLPQLVLAVIVPVSVLVALFLTDPGTAVIVAVTLPLIPVFGALIGTYTEARTKRQWRTLEVLAGHFADVVSGLTTLKVFRRAEFQVREIERISGEHRKATLKSLRVAFMSSLALELAATLSVAVVAVSVGLRLVHGGMAFEAALFVLILAPEAYLPLRQVGTHFHAAQEGLAAAEEIFSSLGEERPAPTAPAPRGSGAPRVEIRSLVVREGLAPATLTLEPGGTTALVGPSGSGKSSLVAALMGFTRPVSGRVDVDGTELTPGTDWEAWREQIAWMSQNPYLFPGTVAENIAIAVPGASGEAVRAAAEATGVLGYTTLDTPLGEEGHGLSAGQAQRIALARVHLRCALLDVRLVLLDEPTAHLDPATELEIREALGPVTRGRTTLLITHRRALAAHADTIVTCPAARRLATAGATP